MGVLEFLNMDEGEKLGICMETTKDINGLEITASFLISFLESRPSHFSVFLSVFPPKSVRCSLGCADQEKLRFQKDGSEVKNSIAVCQQRPVAQWQIENRLAANHRLPA